MVTGDFSDGVDGFRCDYAKGPSHEFWKLFRQEVKKNQSRCTFTGRSLGCEYACFIRIF